MHRQAMSASELVPSACLVGLRALGACFGLSSSLGSLTGFVGCPWPPRDACVKGGILETVSFLGEPCSRMEDIDEHQAVVECWLDCTSPRSPVARSHLVGFLYYLAWPVLPQPFRAMQMQSKLLIVTCRTELPSSSLWYQNWAQIDKAYATPRLTCRELSLHVTA